MNGKRLWPVALIVLLVVVSAKADIAPDPGYQQVRISLFLETQDDLSDYRFFFNARAFIQEVKIKKGEVAEVPGGGGAGSSGKLLAIPKKNLTTFGDEINSENIFDLRNQLGKEQIDGVIEILSHSFQRVVREQDAKNYADVKYLLKRSDEKGIVAVQVESDVKTNKKNALVASENSLSSKLWLIIPGVFLSLAALLFGVLIIRKKSQKSAV